MKSQREAIDSDGRTDEDTEAILNRRRFLIQSTLASAGVGAVMSGCKAEPEPGICLSVDPPEPEPEPEVCLDVAPPEPEPEPQVSQDVEPPEPEPDPEPTICLTVL